MKILLELRPALDGHAGIPQETRLLFRGLRMLDQMDVEGLIIHSGRVLAKALPADPHHSTRRLSAARAADTSSRSAAGAASPSGPFEAPASFGDRDWSLAAATAATSRR